MTQAARRTSTWNGSALKVALALATIALLALAFRLYKLDVLPSWNFDEGRWALGAVSKIRHGDWLWGGWQYGYISPTWTRLIYLDFLFFGPSVMSARYLTVALGVACVPLVYLISRRCGYSARVGLLSALFLALDGYFCVANRQALSDIALTAALAGSFYFALGPRYQRAVFAPVLLALAICTKLTGVFGAAVLLITGFYLNEKPSVGIICRLVRQVWVPIIGVALAAAWFGWAYLGHPHEFIKAWTWEFSLRASRSAVFYNPFVKQGLIDTIKFFLSRMPLLLTTGAVGLVLMLTRRSREHVLPLTWLILGILIIAVQNHQPQRYYLPVLPALCMAAAWAIESTFFAATSAGRIGRLRSGLGVAVSAAIVTYSIVGFVGYYFVLGHTDATGRDVTAWMNAELTDDTGVMGISTYGTGARVRYYPQDYYCGSGFLSDSQVRKLGIDYILYDDIEWKKRTRTLAPHFTDQLQRRFTFVKRIGVIEVWKAKSTDSRLPQPE